MSNISGLAKLILNIVKDTEDPNNNSDRIGPLGYSLWEMARLETERANAPADPSKAKISFSPEIDAKAKRLKIAELNNDLAWIDYDSWTHLTNDFKEMLVGLLDPLFFTGVFFEYSMFLNHRDQLLNQLDETVSMFVLTEFGRTNYLITALGTGHGVYDWMAEMKFRAAKKMYKERCILVMGKGANGVVVKKYGEAR